MRATTISLLASGYYAAEVLGFENQFVFPTDDDLTFYYMNTIEVEYQSDFSNPTLYTWCTKGTGDVKQKDKTSAPKHNGTVSITLDFTSADLCWFDLKEDPSVKDATGFNSVNWTFNADKKNTTTVKVPEHVSTSTTTTTPSTTTASSTPTTTLATTTAADASQTAATITALPTTSASKNDDDTARSTGVKIGVGIGAAVGGLLAMTIIGMVASRCLRKKQANHSEYAASSWPAASFVEQQKPMSAVSYNPVSQFEPSGGADHYRYS